MNMLTYRQFQILEFIYKSEQYVTANFLSTNLGVSIRTIKSEISEINDLIKLSGCKIDSKNGKGYRLIKSDEFNEDLFNSVCPRNFSVEDGGNYNTDSERMLYVIKKLLVIDYHLKLEDLADELFISRTMMSKIMKEIRIRLSKFRLKVVSRPNYGILVEGSEIDKRLAIAEYFFHEHRNNDYQLEVSHMFLNEHAREEYDKMLEIVSRISKQFGIEMSVFSMHNIVIHLNIAMSRCKFYNYVIVDEAIISKWQNSIEFKAALLMIQELENLCNFLLPIGESVYLAHHLRSKRIIENNLLSTDDENKLHQCLNLIMEEVNNNFGLNLVEGCEWYNYMVMHIPPMIERLSMHMTIRNPLVKDHMRRYLFATKITHSACRIIEEVYGVEVDLNEFGYLLLYFNLVVIRFEVNKPMRIAFLSGRGRSESVMIANEIRERFSSQKYQISEVKKVDANVYDLVISTYKTVEDCGCPVVIINDDNYIEKIRNKIDELRYRKFDLDVFCKEEYCSFGLDGLTKEEVIHNFYGELKRKGLFKDNVENNIELIDNEIGNGIVHFQDSNRIIKKNMIYVCTLKKSIYWDKEYVRVIILIKTKKDHDKDLFNICRAVAKWSNDIVKVNRLLKHQNFEVLFGDLKEKL